MKIGGMPYSTAVLVSCIVCVTSFVLFVIIGISIPFIHSHLTPFQGKLVFSGSISLFGLSMLASVPFGIKLLNNRPELSHALKQNIPVTFVIGSVIIIGSILAVLK